MSQLELINSRLTVQDKEIKELKEKLTEEDDTHLPPSPPDKTETYMRFEKLEQLIQSIPALESQAHGHDIIDPELREKLPKKVTLGELPKFRESKTQMTT